MTADECQCWAEEAKALAAQTRDLWEREAFLRVATQWHLIAAHKEDQQAQRIIKEGGGIYPSVPLSAAVLLCFRQKVLFVGAKRQRRGDVVTHALSQWPYRHRAVFPRHEVCSRLRNVTMFPAFAASETLPGPA
jgi:hypothetical protein